jgi:hypothetical protein
LIKNGTILTQEPRYPQDFYVFSKITFRGTSDELEEYLASAQGRHDFERMKLDKEVADATGN